MLLRCDIRKDNVVYGLLLVCMQHDDNYPDIEGKCSVNENKRRSVFAHTLLTENLAQCRIMIDRVETLNIINVCSFFKLTSDTSV
jgi:hypothetical protein